MKKYVKSAILSLRDEDSYALVSLLQDEVTPEQLDELTRHPSWVVRLSVVENPNVTQEILQKLCRDSNYTVCNAAKYRLKEIDG